MKANAEAAVTVSAALITSKKHSKSFAPLIIKFSVVCLSCIGSVFSFISCFANIPAKKAAAVVTAVIFCAVFTFALNMKKTARAVTSLSVSAISLLMVWISRNSICAGLANIINIYLARIKKEFRDKPLIVLAEPDLAAKHTTVCICFLTAFICVSAVYFVSKKWYAIGLCIPPMILPITVLMFGLEPDYPAFVLHYRTKQVLLSPPFRGAFSCNSARNSRRNTRLRAAK